jgi:excinuclease ABC subunit C
MDPTLAEQLKDIPKGPGVYLFKDAAGKILYVGKARSLRKRILSYFQPSRPLEAKHLKLLEEVKQLDWVTTGSEAEALLIEASFIKETQPKYNVALRDDKSYPFLKITVDEPFPRLYIGRGTGELGVKTIGPFANASLLRQALQAIRRVIPFRTCRTMPKRACLDYHMKLCQAPCEGLVTPQQYQEDLARVFQVMQGKKHEVVRELEEKMHLAARQRRYEEAARLRDQIQGLLAFATRPRRWVPSEALADLGSILRLPRPPHRIEGFDVSTLYGRQPVGAMVTFVDGKPFKDGYRRFKIEGIKGMDDYAMMRQIVRRRFSEPWPHPDLILIDGGKGHLHAVLELLKELNLSLPALGIAKEYEQIYLPGQSEPLWLPPDSKALQLLQRVRDEAHRFAIGYHRLLRGKWGLSSSLDEIPGIGPRRRQDLILRFGSVEGIRRAGLEDLLQVRGITPTLAKRILDHLKGPHRFQEEEI